MRRNSMVRFGVGVGVAVVLAVVAAVWLRPAGPGPHRTPIDAVYAADRTLQVHLTYSSCDEIDRIDVAEDEHAVRLTAYVHSLAPATCGTVPIDTRTVPVQLRRPLEDRSVLDGTTGADVLVR